MNYCQWAAAPPPSGHLVYCFPRFRHSSGTSSCFRGFPNHCLRSIKTGHRIVVCGVYCPDTHRDSSGFTRLPRTRHPDWSGSSAARMSPCRTPPLSASHAGCSSSGTSSLGTSDTCGGDARPFSRIILAETLSRFVGPISPFGELLVGRDVDLVLQAANLHDVTQVPRLPVDLDPLFEEGFLSDTAEWRTREESPSRLGAREGGPSPTAGLTVCKHDWIHH